MLKTDTPKSQNITWHHSIITKGDRERLEVCENRDTKGLYKKARAGEIPEYTGISAPYEEPENPELIIETDKVTIVEGASQIISYLEDKGIIE